ncbi:prolyl oligopeptidase family serine peptidase [Mangrovivirga sp. M17]|uniref:prolyl oligopeptidase n=1 Tax=Mangrovivirga halotolerans TaxID=2993936 RepID=A0ABT3RME2_9BACT|nr:prolyl oligopeptidase family serine peptidase [Mangrovivirga halotolerans]MCX2742741.1 prolyl oligopeptidase family serine peptidase [Mangrovivirga halotolerans]
MNAKKILPMFMVVMTINLAFAQQPPEAPVKNHTHKYHGDKLEDPYHYMEKSDKPEFVEWLKAQNTYARNVLNSISGRNELQSKLMELENRQKARLSYVNITENDKYFYVKRTKDEEIGKLYLRDNISGSEQLLFDPQTYQSAENKNYVITGVYPSDNAEKVAFEVAPNGSENAHLLIMDVESKNIHPELIDRVWFSTVSWLPDAKHFLYNRLNSADLNDQERELNSKSFLHEVGTDPNKDKEILSTKNNPDLGIKAEEFPLVFYDKYSDKVYGLTVTVDKYITMYMADAEDLNEDNISWQKVFEKENEVMDFETDDEYLYFMTSKEAPNYKVMRIPVEKPQIELAETVIPEHKNEVLKDFDLSKKGIFYTTRRNGVQSKLYHLTEANSTPKHIDLPFIAGNVNIMTKGHKYDDIWVRLNGWTSDYRRFKYNPDENSFKVEELTDRPDYPEFANLVVEEVMVPSHDGTMVPLSLIYKKGLERNGENPVLMLGYGSYGASINPFFNPKALMWTAEGGIFAISHVRGGGELGEKWHRAGYKSTKPNTWKDFIACAEYLHSENYSSPQKTAIFGGSVGGILIGRAMTERPDLFAAAVPVVGCMNPVRMENSPNGPVNTPEFGTTENLEEYKALLEMDAYHHLEDGRAYPATLVTAGYNDPRVAVWQPAKFAAKLQSYNSSNNPILFTVDFEGGHGVGDTKSQEIREMTDILSFSLWQTGNPAYTANMINMRDR